MFKQILLITDGCSNVGIQPAIAASQARELGITVNVIGIVDDGAIGEYGAAEISEIAKMGGGMSRIVNQRQLSQTVQMLTRKTVVQTIHQAVNQELRHILGREGGSTQLEDLPPTDRSEVVRVMDEMSESTALRIALLIDASASMKPKLAAVEEAIRDLMISLQSRQGMSEVSVFHFPGAHGDEPVVMDVGWVQDMSKVRKLFSRLQMRGTTPTGPALLHVIDYYQYDSNIVERAREDEQSSPLMIHAQHEGTGTGGMWSDYIV